MGAWGVLAFDNDTACDWSPDLEETEDLSLVESVFHEVEAVGKAHLDSDLGCTALAACEVLARLLGRPGYQDGYTETTDAWVASHPLVPSPKLLARAEAAIARVLAQDSALAELWDESDGASWRAAVEELRARLHG